MKIPNVTRAACGTKVKTPMLLSSMQHIFVGHKIDFKKQSWIKSLENTWGLNECCSEFVKQLIDFWKVFGRWWGGGAVPHQWKEDIHGRVVDRMTLIKRTRTTS